MSRVRACLVLVITSATPVVAQAPTVFGYVQGRETYQRGIGVNGSLNRVRIGANGTIEPRLSYRVLVEYESGGSATTAATPALRDAYMKWDAEPFAITVGQFKTPFTREYLTSITAIETADRAMVVDSLAPKRDIGVMAEAAVGPLATLAVGVFNGEGQNRPINRDSALLYVARATVRPIPELTLAGDVARYRTDSTRFGLEGAAEMLGVALRGEYIAQTHSSGPDETGWYVQGAIRVMPLVQLVGKREDFRRLSSKPQIITGATTAGVNVERGRARWIVDGVWRRNELTAVRTFTLVTQMQMRF